MAFKELKLVQKVTNIAPNNKVAVTWTPVADKDVVIHKFVASVGHDLLSNACLVWDDVGVSEGLWIINGNGEIDFKIVIPAVDVDGVKKVSLILLNKTATDNIFMSAMVTMRQK